MKTMISVGRRKSRFRCGVAAMAAAMFVSVGAGLCRGQEKGSAELRGQVAELVDTLDADQLAHRQQAERDLIALGPAALPLLPEADGRYSAEAQQRLRRVRQTLQLERAEADSGARIVRLGSVSTLGEALAKIAEQSGVPLEVQGLAETPLQLSLDSLSFWQTLDTVLDAASLDVNFYAGDPGELVLVPRSEPRPSRTDTAAYAGVYRLEATAATARRDFRRPELNRLSIAIEIAWEPRLTPIGLNLPLDRVTATLDDGTVLKPEPGQLDIATHSHLPFADLSVPLPLPAGSPNRIASLKGVLRAMLPGANEHFEVPLSQPHEPAIVGNLTFWVEQVRADGPLHEVRMEVAFSEAGNAFESHRQWIFENPAYVIDANGQRVEHLGYQVYRQTSERVGIGYLFDLGGDLEGDTFHYVTPVSVVQKEVGFELENIQLP